MRVILIRKQFYSLLSKEEFLCLFSYKSIHQTRIIKQTVFKENGFAYLIKNVRKSSLMHNYARKSVNHTSISIYGL